MLELVLTTMQVINDTKGLKNKTVDKGLPHLHDMQVTTAPVVFRHEEIITCLCSPVLLEVTQQFWRTRGKTLEQFNLKKLYVDEALPTTSDSEYITLYI